MALPSGLPYLWQLGVRCRVEEDVGRARVVRPLRPRWLGVSVASTSCTPSLPSLVHARSTCTPPQTQRCRSPSESRVRDAVPAGLSGAEPR